MKNFRFLLTYCLVLVSLGLMNQNLFSQNSVIQGQVTYGNTSATPLIGVILSLEDLAGNVVATTITGISGQYVFSDVTPGSYTIKGSTSIVPGGFNSTDALIVAKHFVNINPLSGIYLKSANVDQLVNVNMLDALYIQRRFSGIIQTFPNGDWVFEQPVQATLAGETYIVNIKGLCYGDVNGSFIPVVNPFPSCPGIPTFTYGGQLYNTLQIGNQCWMKENLNIGTLILSNNSGIHHSDMTNNGIIEKYCQNNDPANCLIYGGLYEWNELMNYNATEGSQGICPDGWHIPTDQEWCILVSAIEPSSSCNNGTWNGTLAGGIMKEAGTTHWNTPNTGATNASGFTVLGSGDRYPQGYFAGLKNYAVFWTSSRLTPSSNPYYRYFHKDDSRIFKNNQSFKENGFAVRCIKDSCLYQPTQSDAGADQHLLDDSTTLAGNVPVHGIGSWTIVSGSGGTIHEIGNPQSPFTGIFDSTYVLVWEIATGCASTADTVVIEFEYVGPLYACPGMPNVNYAGRNYNTVKIGNQCWMKENLNVGTMINGTSFPSNNGVIEKYCQNNDTNNCNIYGALYPWNEMMAYVTTPGSQGICPSGWHIPTDNDWCILSQYLDPSTNCNISGSYTGPLVGAKLKEVGFTHWLSPNTGATNESNFTAVGSGDRYPSGTFAGLNTYAVYWTSTSTAANPYYRYLRYNQSGIFRNNQSFDTNGFSVRCIKN